MATPTTTTETDTEKKTYAHRTGIYALVSDRANDAAPKTIFAKTRLELNRMLRDEKDLVIHGVFKGRKLEIKERVSFNFN